MPGGSSSLKEFLPFGVRGALSCQAMNFFIFTGRETRKRLLVSGRILCILYVYFMAGDRGGVMKGMGMTQQTVGAYNMRSVCA